MPDIGIEDLPTLGPPPPPTLPPPPPPPPQGAYMPPPDKMLPEGQAPPASEGSSPPLAAAGEEPPAFVQVARHAQGLGGSRGSGRRMLRVASSLKLGQPLDMPCGCPCAAEGNFAPNLLAGPNAYLPMQAQLAVPPYSLSAPPALEPLGPEVGDYDLVQPVAPVSDELPLPPSESEAEELGVPYDRTNMGV
mmetsp:Transcript_74098/g.230412  ORF Transcript_74098/g.230412 Transcript_74098/m.230412 type:complete len:191 (-) Transcript_74098:135-707(-)